MGRSTLQGPTGRLAQQNTVDTLHAPGALADRAEQDQLLQRRQQRRRCGGNRRVRPDPAKGLRQQGQMLLVLAQALQGAGGRRGGGRLLPAEIAARRQPLQLRAQLRQQSWALARCLPQQTGQLGDGTVVAVGGAQLHRRWPERLQRIRS